jgi:DNA-binding transcriptional LysR family regulator
VDTRFLKSFVAVAEYGSLAEASRRLDLTPATIAARVRALEQDLGTALIRRAGRQVKPTEAGLRMLERARLVLRDVRDLRASVTDDAPLGELRLGVSTSALTGAMPLVLGILYQRYPKLAVHVQPGTSSHLYHNVMGGELDAAFIVQPQFAVPKGYAWRLMTEEPLVVLAPAQMTGQDPHRLMAEMPFIRYERSAWGGRLADGYLRRHGIRPHERVEIDGLMAIASLVRHGLGVSLVPDWAPRWLDNLGVARIPLPAVAPIRRMGIIWATQTPHAALSEAFVAAAEQALGLAPSPSPGVA